MFLSCHVFYFSLFLAITSEPVMILTPNLDCQLNLTREMRQHQKSTTMAPLRLPPPFLNWDSLHAKLNSQYEAWNYKKKKYKKIKAYRISVQKEPTIKWCPLILDLKALRSQVKGKHSISRKFRRLAVPGNDAIVIFLIYH